MNPLYSLLNTKPPKKQTLLDIALALSLVPHLFAFEGFVVVFLLIALYFIFKAQHRSYEGALLFGVGALSIGVAFFNSYNFSDFSRMQFFVSLVSSVLLLAVVLQRHKREINFYLLLSPVLFMLLSFFFFDTISMLLYSLFAFFVLVLLLVWSRMEAPLGEVLRLNTMLFLLSLPAVVVLFIAFPRISFEKADFGFRAENYTSGAFDGSMYVSDAPFVPRNKIVMELFFKEGLPAEDQLYFRGSVLYPNAAFVWESRDDTPKDFLSHKERLIEYDLLLHPHAKKWLFALDMPTLAPPKIELQNAMTLESKKELYESKRYTLESALRYRLTSQNPEHALEVNATAHPKTAAAMHSIEAQTSEAQTPQQKAEALVAFFLSQQLAYTIAPKNLDTKNPVDSFLFEAKNGYCTHFASSFAIAARLLGVPSRVVSGYKADYSDRVENYLIVKQKDAHAWVELYLGERGWVRFEPTATAFKNLDTQINEQNAKQKETLFYKINLQYMYVKYLINNWILGFDRLKQMAILESLLSDTLYLLKFVGALLLVTFVAFVLAYMLIKSRKNDPLANAMRPLYRFLQKEGFEKERHESMEHFLHRAHREGGFETEEIKRCYHEIKYSQKARDLGDLKQYIAKLLKEHSHLN